MVRRKSSGIRRCGAVLALVAISLVALFGVAGLVIDGGMMVSERRHAQAIADSAALAGAQDLLIAPGAASQARASALDYARAQGYANDGTLTIVTVNTPPTSGPYAGDPDKITVKAEYNLKTAFMQVLNSSRSFPVRAQATAGVERKTPDANSLIALSPNGSGALTITGSGFVDLATGKAQVNSTAADALKIVGSASGRAGAWNVAGGYATVAGSGGGGGGNGNGTFSPNPTTGAAAVADPLRNLAPPSSSGLPSQSGVSLTGSNSVTLNPGVYNGGIVASGSSSVTLSPGVYIMNGGGLQITGNAGLSAAGVTIYNTGTTANFGPITITSPNASFSPPTSGTYKGLMLYQDPLNTQGAQLADPQSGGLKGTYYLPGARLTFNANGGGIDHFQVIAGSITMNTDTPSGNADISIPYDASSLAPVPQLYLLD